MKKALKLTALCLVLAIAVSALASCGGLSGTYSCDVMGTGVKMAFDGDNVKISITYLGAEAFSTSTTYTIEDDKISFNLADEEKVESTVVKAVIAWLETPLAFEEGDDYIKIGVFTFTEVKD